VLVGAMSVFSCCCPSDGVEMLAFKKGYDSGLCRRVKIAARKGKFHGHRMLWSMAVEDASEF
jgi:hypothetical protein